MGASETMTIRVRPEVKAKLNEIAVATRRSKSFLAGEALAAYVERELEIIEGIQRGLEDVKAGRTVSHEEATARLLAVVEAAEARKASNA